MLPTIPPLMIKSPAIIVMMKKSPLRSGNNINKIAPKITYTIKKNLDNDILKKIKLKQLL